MDVDLRVDLEASGKQMSKGMVVAAMSGGVDSAVTAAPF